MLSPARAAGGLASCEHRRYKGPVDGTAVLGTPTPPSPAAAPPPGRWATWSRPDLPKIGRLIDYRPSPDLDNILGRIIEHERSR